MSRSNPVRAILHIDMDAFYVACEVRRRPELAGRPVIVGGTGNRGVVAAASYEARCFGVRSAMPTGRARRLCPQAVVLAGDHALYADVSREVHRVLRSYTPVIEPIALDEAFMDVTGALRLFGRPAEIAWALRRRIAGELALSCSVGAAANKLLAKLASEAAKPRPHAAGVTPGLGVVEVAPGRELEFLHPLAVQSLWGVGPSTLESLTRLGVRTIADLAAVPRPALVAALGRANGTHLHLLAQAVDDSPVVAERAPKSISHEETFPRDLHARADLDRELLRLADAVAARLRQLGLAGRTVSVKVRFGDFHTVTRSLTVPEYVETGSAIVAAARCMLDTVDPAPGVRLLGVSLAGLASRPGRQLALDGVATGSPHGGWLQAERTVDAIRRRFGDRSIGPAALVEQGRLQTLRGDDQRWGPNG